ncbi:sodium:solute symporter [Pedobacter changchengzhani]|uniref:Sodium:solute symporter n=1 Tax=Pedobacter changchengzhani TaxID=2529274 RepID=A0A4R5MIH5_9SPHI|nr:sodium:solute symporter [Pedobacter changchengzhani]TDG35364.1 sodium:solute symporter [Pedobacter changchengzhani]
MNISTTDLIVFLVYMFGTLIFGCSFYFRNKSSNTFTSGDGNMPAWVVGMSIFATFVSSISFLALPGSAYAKNWNGFVFSLSIPIAAYLAVKFFVPLYREVNSPSAYTFLEKRFGPWARIYASLCYMLTQVARMGSIMFLLALPINALFGWNIYLIIIVTGACVLLYSMLGGITAVIWTDAIQGIVLIAGALICAIILLYSMPEGPMQTYQIAKQYDKLSLGGFNLDFSKSTFWVILIYGLFINVQNFGIDQSYVQRYMTTGSLKKAKFSTWFGSLLYIPVSMLFFIIGTALFAYYHVYPDLLPATLKASGMGDRVFPYFIAHGLPKGVTGLLIAAIFAAGMSSISTSLNSSATVILTDYYERYFQKNASNKKSMRVLYLSTFTMGILGVLAALAMTQVKNALDAWWGLSSVFSGGMLGLFLLGYFSKKVKNVDAAIGVSLGCLAICWVSLSPVYFTNGIWISFKSTLNTNLAIVIGTIIIFLTGFLSYSIFNRQK